jgi:hypothetical protein
MTGESSMDSKTARSRISPRLVAVALVFGRLISAAGAQTPASGACDVHLELELTPDVPNPSDVSFLSSLLNYHIGYRLIFQGRRDGDVLVELTGPGPDYLCRDVIQTMRRDGRILTLRRDRVDS